MSEKLDNVDDKWFRAEISKKDLKELSKKSDLKGLQHVTIYFIPVSYTHLTLPTKASV